MPSPFNVTNDELLKRINAPQTDLDLQYALNAKNSKIAQDYNALMLEKAFNEAAVEELFIKYCREYTEIDARKRAEIEKQLRTADYEARLRFLESFVKEKLPAASSAESAALTALRQEIKDLLDDIAMLATQHGQLVQQQINATIQWQNLQQTRAAQLTNQLVQQLAQALPNLTTPTGQPVFVTGPNGQPTVNPARMAAVNNAMQAAPPALLARINPTLANAVINPQITPGQPQAARNNHIQQVAQNIVNGMDVFGELRGLAALGGDMNGKEVEPLTGSNLLQVIRAAKQFAAKAHNDPALKSLMVKQVVEEFRRNAEINKLAAGIEVKEKTLREKIAEMQKLQPSEQKILSNRIK